MREHKYKIGQKVRVRPGTRDITRKRHGWNPNMEETMGGVYEIEKLRWSRQDTPSYHLSCGWNYPEEALQPIGASNKRLVCTARIESL